MALMASQHPPVEGRSTQFVRSRYNEFSGSQPGHNKRGPTLNLASHHRMKRFFALAVWPLALALVAVACATAKPAPPPTNTPFPDISPAASPTTTPAPSATSSPSTPIPSPTPTESPTPETLPSPAQVISQSLLERLRRIQERVSDDRGLGGADEPARRFMTRPELQAYYAQQFEDSNSDEEITTTQQVLELLGLLEEGQDLKQLLVDLFSEGVLGFFDTETGELVVVGEVDEFGALEEITYAHEFTHALQHQRFDLLALQELVEEDSEANAALRALVEGDATLSMFQYAGRYLSPEEIRSLSDGDGETEEVDAPQFLIDSISFPYREGLEFVGSLYRAGGWEAVNSAYNAPPVSTEQILHPDKYGTDQPVKVVLPELGPALGEGWELRDEDTLGEFDLKLMFKVHVSDSAASRAAEGWGGDRFVYFQGPAGERLLVLLAVWDSSKDADEFFDAYGRWLRSQEIGTEETGKALVWSTEECRSSLRLQEDRTLLILAPAGDVSEEVLSLFPDFRPTE